MNKKTRMSFTCVVILLALLFAGCQLEKEPTKIGDLAPESQRELENRSQESIDRIYEVGDIISIDNTILVVLGWDQPPGGDFNPPDAGKKYLVVDVMLANQGENSFNISPVFQMTLKDSTGQKYNVNGKANLASGSNTPNGEINPGEVIRGKVGFHVPEDLVNFVFVYEVNLIGLGEVSVNLGPIPVSMEPPPDLNLAQQQIVYQVGDLIEISDLAIQVLQVTYPAGNEIVKPKEDFKFVAVDVTVENQGNTTQEISSIVQMYLKDSTGQKYTFHLGAQSIIDSGLPDDELQPGEKIRGQIGYQVPKDVQGLIFVFDAEIFGFGKVFIALE
jgi:signal peptidase I